MPAARRLCALEELVPGTAQRFEVEGRQMAVVRIGDEVYAIGDRCTHQDVSLSGGEVLADELELECPKHGSTFSLRDGTPRSLPATRPVPVYEARIVDGDVEILLPEGL